MECLSEKPSDRPTAQQLLQRLGALLERRSFEGNPSGRRALPPPPFQSSPDFMPAP